MTLATYTAVGEAQCGKIIGIGMPPREETYELTLEQEDGTVDYVNIPRVMEKHPDFNVGAYYVHFMVDGKPVDPATLMAASLFNKLFTMTAKSKSALEKAKADAKKAAEEAAKASLKESKEAAQAAHHATAQHSAR